MPLTPHECGLVNARYVVDPDTESTSARTMREHQEHEALVASARAFEAEPDTVNEAAKE